MLSSDLKVFSSLANGRKSAVQINTGVVQNVFAHVTSAQRTTGLTDYAKTHWCAMNSDNYALIDPEAYHDYPTLSVDDYVVLCELDQRDPVSTLATTIAAADKYGSGLLDANIVAGVSTFDVDVGFAALAPGGADGIFRDGDTVRVCSHTLATGSDGVEEDCVISGTPTVSGTIVTITRVGEFTNSFTADGTIARVSSLIKPTADTEATCTTPVVTSSAGVMADTVELDNRGTQDEDWTLTWTDATHFTLTGDSLTPGDSGTVGVEFAPINSDYTKPYFTIPAAALTGTWVAGDTATFTTHPATVPIGQKRVVAALASSLANNKVTQVLGGEAAG